MCFTERSKLRLRGRCRALTLVEIMVATAIIGLTFIGITGGLLLSLRSSDLSIARTAAHDVAMGFAEQLMAREYVELRDALAAGTGFDIAITELDTTGTGVSFVDQPVSFGTEFGISVIREIESDGTNVSVTSMPMRFQIDAVDLNSGADARAALEITIRYSYLPPASRSQSPDGYREDYVHIVKSALTAI